MGFSLDAPEPWASGNWKIRIFSRERGEEPHINFVRRSQVWRWGLRRRVFMDRRPDPREVPPELVEFALQNLPRLIAEWNAENPHNPVAPSEPEDE